MDFRKLSLAVLLCSAIVITGCNQDMDDNGEADLSSEIDSVSYALGFQNGTFLAREGITDIDMSNYAAGLSNGLGSEEGALTQDEVYAVVNRYVQQLNEERSTQNTEEGTSFLEENKNKEDVMVTDSGLQYKVLEEGEGESPSTENIVRVNYEGRLIDGEVFDSSYDRGQPAEFPLNQVIPGWTEGVQLMREGATYEFYIPSELAYGARPPQGSPIGPNETLIFKVELLEVKEAPSSN
ncbi:FKBP-type peptidyl-prolyl cis-trans isomerase [Gracilimonas sp. Q87]|uniref:FKBP-type peptidyl-prolyl cis-trans isomerase n=1 Tax=Gracilimonas sp. Q87 TaxID=3384766 RepID=UPI00398422FD